MSEDLEHSLYERRISEVEVSVAEVATSVQQLQYQMKDLVTSIHSIRDNFNNTVQHISDSSKARLGPMITAVSVGVMIIIAFMSLLMNGYVRDQNRNESSIKDLFHSYHEHTMTDGHTAMLQRVESLEEGVINLDTVLQREMRLLDARGEEKAQATRERVEMELQLMAVMGDAHIDNVNKRIDAIESIVIHTPAKELYKNELVKSNTDTGQ